MNAMNTITPACGCAWNLTSSCHVVVVFAVELFPPAALVCSLFQLLLVSSVFTGMTTLLMKNEIKYYCVLQVEIS